VGAADVTLSKKNEQDQKTPGRETVTKKEKTAA